MKTAITAFFHAFKRPWPKLTGLILLLMLSLPANQHAQDKQVKFSRTEIRTKATFASVGYSAKFKTARQEP